MSDIFTVDEEFAGNRIDVFLSLLYKEYSRSYLQKIIKNNNVSINGSDVKPSQIVESGDRIVVDIPNAVLCEIQPEDIELEITHEDDDIIIVNKPKNMVVHPAPGHYTGTLVNALMYHCRDNLSDINGVLRPGIVHRIDKDTTGLIVSCKNNYSHNFISEQLSRHAVERKYFGIVKGVLKEDEGTINSPIGRDKRDRKKFSVDPDGKPAITHYNVLKRFKEYSFCEFRLETGRTHQIRVHMKSLGYPLLGDETYGGESKKFNLNGQTLHAATLGFIHPKTKEFVKYTADLPGYFKHLLEILK